MRTKSVLLSVSAAPSWSPSPALGPCVCPSGFLCARHRARERAGPLFDGRQGGPHPLAATRRARFEENASPAADRGDAFGVTGGNGRVRGRPPPPAFALPPPLQSTGRRTPTAARGAASRDAPRSRCENARPRARAREGGRPRAGTRRDRAARARDRGQGKTGDLLPPSGACTTCPKAIVDTRTIMEGEEGCERVA